MLSDRLSPESMGKIPLEMSQSARLFTTVRLPGREMDQLVSHQTDCLEDLLLIVKHQHYVVRVVRDDGSLLSATELAAQFRRCLADASSRDKPLSVGMLTAGGRTRWAEAREIMMQDHGNRDAFDVVERSFFVLALDDEAPATDDEAAALAIAGNGHQRWYDKLCTVVVFSNGRFAGNGEHSAVDAPATNLIFSHITKTKFVAEAPAAGGGVAADAARAALERHARRGREDRRGRERVQRVARATWPSRCSLFGEWGREHLKSRRASPDTVIQMAMQLAQMMLHGNTVATYETAQTRQFAVRPHRDGALGVDRVEALVRGGGERHRQ
jgi:hypothetical protein